MLRKKIENCWPCDVSKFISVEVTHREKLNVAIDRMCSNEVCSGKICVHGVARGACINAGWDLSCVCGNFDVIRIGSAQGDVTRLMRYAMVSAVRSYELQSMMSVMQSVMSMMQFVTNEIRPGCVKWVAGDTVSCWTVNRVLSTSGSVRNYVSNTCVHPGLWM